jgi:glyoxylase-like metal-dependent hydrolase (beta-lactamase superfamily II)/predicted ester cyclase
VATTDEPAARSRPSKATTAKIARAYLAAINEHDLEAAVAFWAPGGRETIHGQIDTVAPDGVRAYFGGLFAAVPDLRLTELSCTAEASRCAIRSRMTGTFAGTAPLFGANPNGARIDVELVDNFVVEDGRIVANDAYVDGMTVARQLGLLPSDGSTTQTALTRAFNAKTKATARTVSDLEKAAEGVWRLRGGFPGKDFNVYFIEEDDGVTVFDAGIRAMTNAVAAAGARLGGIKRVVLGHAHADHRGSAPYLDAPVHCHPDEVVYAESEEAIEPYWDLSLLPVAWVRWLYPTLLRRWDGGAVKIAGTLGEGEEVAGFEVLHMPGHAPGLIALWRERDRVALVSDIVYLVDSGRLKPLPHGEASVPHPAWAWNHAKARASVRRLAALEPELVLTGHEQPLRGPGLRATLERAAEK